MEIQIEHRGPEYFDGGHGEPLTPAQRDALQRCRNYCSFITPSSPWHPDRVLSVRRQMYCMEVCPQNLGVVYRRRVKPGSLARMMSHTCCDL